MDQDAALTAPASERRLQIAVAQEFAGGFAIDAAVDIGIAAGGMLVVFGPSGAGKTTLLRQIAGLERPARGRIAFGEEVWCDTAAGVWQPAQRRGVGVVFQEPTLFPHLTVRDNIRYGVGPGSSQARARLVPGTCQAPGEAPGTCQAPVAEIARVLGIADLENRYPRALSGGEAQRVALARALATAPRLLLLDEPFAALDAPTRARLRRDVRALLQTTGTPAVLVTHDRTEALALGDSIAVLVGGRVRQAGAIADVFSHPADADVAASLGVEAVLPARVLGTASGIVELAVDDVMLHAAERDPIAAGAQVYACIRAEDVTLETGGVSHASTRNHLAARVVHISSEGPIDRVTLDCGFALDALITRRSRDELKLAAGMRVTAAIKATSIHLVPRVSSLA
jgi:molybdenum ABC transporter ATP-binding protein